MNLFDIGERTCKVGRTSITVCDERGKTCGVVRNVEAPGMEGKKMANVEKIKVTFAGGEARDWHPGDIHIVNYMRAQFEDKDGDEVELYAEYAVNESDDEVAGYDELKAEIIEQAAEYGIAAERLHFYYDDVDELMSAVNAHVSAL